MLHKLVKRTGDPSYMAYKDTPYYSHSSNLITSTHPFYLYHQTGLSVTRAMLQFVSDYYKGDYRGANRFKNFHRDFWIF